MNKQKLNKQDDNSDEEQISFVKLENYIDTHHPTNKNAEKYPICKDIGYVPLMNCCFKK